MEVFRISDKGPEYRVGKVMCIGRNYAEHAKELGNAVPESPMVFLKPSSSIISSGEDIVIPRMSQDVHHEVELVCLIGRKGKDIPTDRAMEYVAGYAVGLDMTARDLQSEAKSKGHPWSVAKGFDTFAPLGAFIERDAIKDVSNLNISLTIDGQIRQQGTTQDMIYGVSELISWCSSIFTLEPGDLLYTGTPKGVGPIQAGETLVAKIEGLPDLVVGVRNA